VCISVKGIDLGAPVFALISTGVGRCHGSGKVRMEVVVPTVRKLIGRDCTRSLTLVWVPKDFFMASTRKVQPQHSRLGCFSRGKILCRLALLRALQDLKARKTASPPSSHWSREEDKKITENLIPLSFTILSHSLWNLEWLSFRFC
jgi:hypothetical protein